MSVTVTPPRALYVGASSIEQYSAEGMDAIMRDPRGLLLMYEEPQPRATYSMGMDPTVGKTGWTRHTRIEGDHKIDNGAIEIFRIDAYKFPLFKEMPNPSGKGFIQVPDVDPLTKQQRYGYKDLQVAEFAAPCDAVEIARIANVLGHIYCGVEEDQCQLIYEAYPGPGLLTTQELLRLGYANLWMWQYIDRLAEDSDSPGWRSTPRSQQALWERSRRHLLKKEAIIRSKWLLAEYSNAEIDPNKMRARASYGYHDDRMQAANMAFWAGHKWAQDVEHVEQGVTTSPAIDFQRYAPVLGEGSQSYSDWREAATADWD